MNVCEEDQPVASQTSCKDAPDSIATEVATAMVICALMLKGEGIPHTPAQSSLKTLFLNTQRPCCVLQIEQITAGIYATGLSSGHECCEPEQGIRD